MLVCFMRIWCRLGFWLWLLSSVFSIGSTKLNCSSCRRNIMKSIISWVELSWKCLKGRFLHLRLVIYCLELFLTRIIKYPSLALFHLLLHSFMYVSLPLHLQSWKENSLLSIKSLKSNLTANVLPIISLMKLTGSKIQQLFSLKK